MIKRQIRLSEQDLKKIESAVQSAEKKTSGEIVPMIVDKSHDYWWVHWAWAFIFLGLYSIYAYFYSADELHHLSIGEVLLYQLGMFLSGFSLPLIDLFKRALLPKAWTDAQVHKMCLANFMAEGLQNTRDRTGVLIYISQMERRVEILADVGIYNKTPEGYWNEQVSDLVRGIHEGQFALALSRVIGHIGDKLAENFPPRKDDTDELSNELRTGHSQREKNPETD